MTLSFPHPGDAVVARAPVRVADVGGWTDTWFAAPGRVCNVAVGPGVTAAARWIPPNEHRRGAARTGLAVRLVAPDVGADYSVGPDEIDGWSAPAPGHHPLLEHAIAAIVGDGDALHDASPGVGIEIEVGAAVPAGASLGTSASAVVAVLAALDGLVAGGRRCPAELALLAHQIETVRAGREAGVQDQWAAAMGGCSHLHIPAFERGGSSPHVLHEPVSITEACRDEIEARWLTVVFGSHDSSAVHGEVIAALLAADGTAHGRIRAALGRLTELADDAAERLAGGQVTAWADTLRAASETQEHMHPALLGPAHRATIEVAARLGASGWKVNGAGGAGGSLTLVMADDVGVSRLRAALADLDHSWRVLDLRCSGGVELVSGCDPAGPDARRC